MELEKLSATQLGELVNRGELMPSEVIQYFAERIEKYNPVINAFTYTKIEDAMQEALKLDRKILKDEYCGPFAGVPIGLKDFLPSKKGWTNSHGGVPALVREDDADSMFYSAASQLGAIAIGKTNAPAFGFSGACQNTMYGATRNPFDVTRTSGGSSGGSAAAVAAGLTLMSEGGDAGGSIRIPAGWCNLFGMKPSLGTVPSYCRPDGWAATHPYCFNGALTKTVEDSAQMLNAMARYNPRDPISLPINDSVDFLQEMKKSIKGKRIAFTYDFDLFPAVAFEVKKTVGGAAALLEQAGARIEPVRFHFKHSLEEIMYCWAWSISVDTALDLEQWKREGLDLIKDHREELPEEFIKFNEIAAKAGIQDFRKFNEIRTDILDNFEDIFDQGYYAIISPTAICTPLPNDWNGHALEVNGITLDPETNFISFAETALANFIGYPAASVPAGMIDGCPIGMQVIGEQYHDGDVFAIAHSFEQIKPWIDNFKY